MLKNNKGFSLIELMVVVAIIGLLASFAIPQYSSFQAKARQKEGQSLLNSYFTASKATEADAGFVFGNFPAIGFAPTGQVHYRVTAADAVQNPASGSNDNACFVTTAACNCGGACATFKTWAEAPAGGTFGPAAPSACAAVANSATGAFTTCVSATIRSNAAADVDTWSVTNFKVITNTNDGIN